MNNFARAHNSYLEPPDEPEAVLCEECGEEMAPKYDGMKCTNQYCPSKFNDGSIERDIAQALVEALEDLELARNKIRILKARD